MAPSGLGCSFCLQPQRGCGAFDERRARGAHARGEQGLGYSAAGRSRNYGRWATQEPLFCITIAATGDNSIVLGSTVPGFRLRRYKLNKIANCEAIRTA